MLVSMSDRGPDSAGIAIYSEPTQNMVKITLQSATPTKNFPILVKHLKKVLRTEIKTSTIDTHIVIVVSDKEVSNVLKNIKDLNINLSIMSVGENIEIYKEVGLPKNVASRFNLSKMKGSHGIGHTRMATESAITTMGAHPFNTGPDQCLVHNGSLSNHNLLRRKLKQNGIAFETENDSEVAAAFITYKMRNGASLEQALKSALYELDGFYTFVVGTKNGFGVLRDRIACKPAVLAETDQYVAFGSEYRALTNLPNINLAKVWEPEPATVYFWTH